MNVKILGFALFIGIIMIGAVVFFEYPFSFDDSTDIVYSPYDINKDGVVDQADADLISDHYGETGSPGWIREDVNQDGVIDVDDISLVMSHSTET